MLIRLDGQLLRVVCIVDRDARRDATFGLPPADMLAVAHRWGKRFDPSARRRGMDVSICEVGVGAVTAAARARLAGYVDSAGFPPTLRVRAALANRGAVWSDAGAALGDEGLVSLLGDLAGASAQRRPDRLPPPTVRGWIGLVLRLCLDLGRRAAWLRDRAPSTRARARPRRSRVVPMLAVLVAVLSVPIVVGLVEPVQNAALFEPWPHTEAEACARAYDIITAKPRDPRGHFIEALTLLDVRDLPGAEAELRRALSDPQMLALLAPGAVDRIRAALADVLRDEHGRGSTSHQGQRQTCSGVARL